MSCCKFYMGNNKNAAKPVKKKVLINFDGFLFNCIKEDDLGFTYKCSEKQCLNYFNHFVNELISMTQSEHFLQEYLLPTSNNDHRSRINDSETLERIVKILKHDHRHNEEWLKQVINDGMVYETGINVGGARLFFVCVIDATYFEIRPLFLDLHHVVIPDKKRKYDETKNFCFHCLRKRC